jgi:thiamine-phosphate pyrophosphorylase
VAVRAGWAPADLARASFDGGARLVQLRAKHLGSAHFLTLCESVVQIAVPFGASVIVNDRADVAALARAAGVHVGQEDLPAADARRLVGPGRIVGVSTHTVAQIEAALREPISYLAVGPVFGTATKDTGYSPVGLELVATAARLAGGIPVVAIGGITLDTAPAVWQAGAASVAVISDLVCRDPTAQVASYNRAYVRQRGSQGASQ